MVSENLDFLKGCSNDELRVLSDIILLDKDKQPRLTEELTCTQSYKDNYPDNVHGYLKELIEELELFGGNTVANILRWGEGVPYSEILHDVAKKQKVNFKYDATDETIERYLVQKLIDDTLDKMSEEELRELTNDLGIKVAGKFTKQAATAALMTAFRLGGFASYKLLVIVANAIAKFILGRGLSLVANAALTRWAAVFVGPVGWIITGLWTMVDIAGPAYRVTIPAVIQIALLRQLQIMKPNDEKALDNPQE